MIANSPFWFNLVLSKQDRFRLGDRILNSLLRYSKHETCNVLYAKHDNNIQNINLINMLDEISCIITKVCI